MSAHHREPTARRAPGAAVPPSATIGRRVARILALPAAVVLLLLGVVAAEQIQGYRNSQDTARSVRLSLAVQGLIHELQAERGVAAGVLGGNPSFRNELAPARRQVDVQRAVVAGLVRGGGTVEAGVRSALQQLDGLPAVRSATDTAAAGRAAMFDYFTQRIAALSDVDLGLDRASDSQLRRGASALQALVDLSEATAQERAFMNGVFSAGGFHKGEFVQFAAMRTARGEATARFRRFATSDDRAGADYVAGTGAAQVTAYFEQVALDAADGRHVVVNPQSWWSGLTTVLDDVRQLQRHVGSQIELRAHDLQTSATRRIVGLLVAVLFCLGGSGVLAVMASLSITRPLATLAAEADAVATERLPLAMRRVQLNAEEERTEPPEPPPPVKVPTRATREISSVASALDRLQSAAFELSTEQATQRQRTVASLANLGRRNQNLIRRQLGFITNLEGEEMDPTALANLFELDHLATRMRRNATSLLVLVGESSPRPWSTPVPVANVIRAAVSEVEEYRRVVLRRVDETLVAGAAVGSVVHLISELIENGLTFSPPDSEVEVQGRWVGGGYLIAITDQGVGMTGDALREANGRLRGEGDFIAAPTRFLGHFVVGQLAREAGIDVQLVPSPVVGVTARVTLPAAVLSSRMAVEAGAAARPMVAARPVSTRSSVAMLDAPGPDTGELALSYVVDGFEPDEAGGGRRRPEIPEPVPAGRSSDGVHLVGSGPHPAPRTGPVQFSPSPPLDPPPWNGRPGESAWDTWDPDGSERSGANGGPVVAGGTTSGPVPGSVPGTVPGSVPGSVTGRGRIPTGSAPATRPGTDGGDGERTRNGLRKRTPRDRRVRETADPPPARRVIDLDAAARSDAASSDAAVHSDAAARPDGAGRSDASRAEVVDDSPAQVRARLTSLRAGMDRGQGTPAGTGAVPPPPTGSQHLAEDSE